MEWLRRRIEHSVLEITKPPGTIDYLNPPGDPGLFGPSTATWKVHADFTSMLVGGVGALMLQMLHPKALAGVWDHSNFREDMLGRLQRTARFIGMTSFGNTADAEMAIARVRHIHLAVKGTTAAGAPYDASDPDLLTWVHVAEVHCFLRAHLLYKNPSLSRADQDRYFDEIARVAEKLGARDIPRSLTAVETYLAEMRPQLVCDARTRETLRLVLDARPPQRFAVPYTRLMMKAGVDLLPDWAQRELGLPIRSPLQRAVLHQAVRAAAQPLRWAVRNGAAHKARRRMAERNESDSDA